MQRYQERQIIPNVPSGGNAVGIGDSITNNASAGQYLTQLAARYGWTLLGLTDAVMNGQFETNATGWNAETNCTIARDSTCPGKSNITGAWALKVTATATGLAFPNIGSGLNVLQLGAVAGQYQTVGTAVWIQAGFTGNVYLQCYDRPTGGGAYVTTSGASVNAASGAGVWQYITLIRLVPALTTEWFVRVILDAPTAGQAIWIDGAYVVHTNGIVLPAIGGASLATNAACGNANSILDNFAARVTAFSAPLYLLMAGTNDFFNMTDSAWVGAHGGPLYTPAAWGVAIRSAITQILALSGHPALVVFGMLPANSQVPNMGRLPSYATSGQDLRNQMDAQTRAACLENHVPFVPLWDMPIAYTDGIHPDASLLVTGQLGHTWMAQRFQDVMNRVVK